MTPPSQVCANVRVLVVASDELTLRWISKRLDEGECTVEAKRPPALDQAPMRGDAFDAAVLAGDLSDGRSMRLVRDLRLGCPCASVLSVAESVDPSVMIEAISLGVVDIIVRLPDSDGLHAAVMRAASTTARWRRQLEDMSIFRCAGPRPTGFIDVGGCLDRLVSRGNLTPREQDVLRSMLRGLRLEEIARALHISANTVKFHVRNVLSKLELRSRSELLRLLVD